MRDPEHRPDPIQVVLAVLILLILLALVMKF
jgi:hypothetical protein